MRPTCKQLFVMILFLLMMDQTPSLFASPPLATKSHKTFRRALVIPGGGRNSAVFLGVLAGLRARHWYPDVIFSSCGGSIATAIAHRFSDSQKELQFIQSQSYYDLLNTAQMNPAASSDAPLLSNLKDVLMKGNAESGIDSYEARVTRRVPSLFEEPLVLIPQRLNLPLLNAKLSKRTPRAIFVASQALFEPIHSNALNIHNADFFKETLFTDPDTARAFSNKTLKSPIRKFFPGSEVAYDINIITQAKIGHAVRATLSDPLLMEPEVFKNSHFTSGAIDLYPVELAAAIADEVLMILPDQFDFIEQATIHATFGYDNNIRREQVIRNANAYVSGWIDIRNLDTELNESRFKWGPHFSINPNPFSIFRGKIEVDSNFPRSYGAAFTQMVQEQWIYGKNQALKAKLPRKDSK